MAAWQFDVQLIPRTKAEEVLGANPREIDQATLDDVDWWGNGAIAAEAFEAALAPLLQRAVSWNQATSVWGDEDGDRIDLRRDNNAVASCYARIDARHISADFIAGLVGLARRFDCLLVTPNLRLIEPTTDELWDQLERSAARKYADNPEIFLARRCRQSG